MINKLKKISLFAAMSVLLVSCGGGSDDSNTTNTVSVTGNLANGTIYYSNNCAICHGDEGVTSTGFGANSLVGLESRIKSDMSDLDATNNLMANYSKLSAQRVADLQAYLKQN